MKSTAKRIAAVAAVGAAGVLGPVANASAASTPSLPAAPPIPTLAATQVPLASFKLPSLSGLSPLALPAFTPPAFTPSLAFVGPSVGQVAAVIGPTVITTAPSTFNNTNIQVSAGSNGTGGQVGP